MICPWMYLVATYTQCTSKCIVTPLLCRYPPPHHCHICVISSLPLRLPPPSVRYTALLTYFPKLSPECSNHCCVTHTPDRSSAARHSSSIGRVAIYCAAVLWNHRTHVSTSSNSTAVITSSSSGQTHLFFVSYISCISTIWWSTMWWITPRFFPILGYMTQFSSPNSRVTWTTAL